MHMQCHKKFTGQNDEIKSRRKLKIPKLKPPKISTIMVVELVLRIKGVEGGGGFLKNFNVADVATKINFQVYIVS